MNSVTANGRVASGTSNKRNALRCGKCGKYFDDYETVYKHYMTFKHSQDYFW